MKIETWLLQNEDADTIYAHLCNTLSGRLDKNAQDALRSIISKFCTRRSPYSRDVRIRWIVANRTKRRAYLTTVVQKEFDFNDPPEYPTWIEISWNRGFGTSRITRAVNLKIRPSSKSGG